MPIYEYQCTKCRRMFEILQKMSDAPVRSCEKCGGRVKRLISSSAFILKGSGWYATDYARKGKGGKDEKEEAAGEKAPESTKEKESESGEPGKDRKSKPASPSTSSDTEREK